MGDHIDLPLANGDYLTVEATQAATPPTVRLIAPTCLRRTPSMRGRPA